MDRTVSKAPARSRKPPGVGLVARPVGVATETTGLADTRPARWTRSLWLRNNAAVRQVVSFAQSSDGTRIAWARHGSGPPLVRVGTWLTNLEQDWESPVWKHWLTDLGERFTVIRYDERGCGLSDRSSVEVSIRAWLADLEAVVDAARVERFALLGMSQAGAVAVEFAARHPDRISRLVLYGAYGRGSLGRHPTPEDRGEFELRGQLIKVGWGRADPVFRRVFTTSFIPDASERQMRWFDELQRLSTSPEIALASRSVRSTIDVTAAASRLTVPTLVLHADDDRVVPFEEGRRLAGLIPGAVFVPLESRNHILLADEPAWPRLLEEVTAFLGAAIGRPSGGAVLAVLSARELQVLRFVSEGLGNDDIAGALGLSTRTVERHLSNIYDKLSLSGRSARAAAAVRLADLDRSAGTG